MVLIYPRTSDILVNRCGIRLVPAVRLHDGGPFHGIDVDDLMHGACRGGEHEGMAEGNHDLDGAHAAIIRACARGLDFSIKAAPVLDARTCKV